MRREWRTKKCDVQSSILAVIMQTDVKFINVGDEVELMELMSVEGTQNNS